MQLGGPSTSLALVGQSDLETGGFRSCGFALMQGFLPVARNGCAEGPGILPELTPTVIPTAVREP